MKTNPELYSYFQDLAEKRNAETSGIGQFINFLPLSSDQLSDAQTDVPKLHGIDLVGIAKIGFTSRIFLKSALISLESDTPSSSQLNINILSYDINCKFVKLN